ncbi:hypothetical protein BAC2_00599 [uncultured bacterium]|nr:hypothetical protein BAC2_00599 [uncultured bacterium]
MVTADRTGHLMLADGLAPGDILMARSQAKGIAAQLGGLTDVTLDFRGIATVGPSFTDELFRVFQARHPEVTLRWVNAEPYVAGMIRKALEALADQRGRDVAPGDSER